MGIYPHPMRRLSPYPMSGVHPYSAEKDLSIPDESEKLLHPVEFTAFALISWRKVLPQRDSCANSDN